MNSTAGSIRAEPASRPEAAAPARDSFWRSLQTLNFTRVVVAVVLLVYLSFSEQAPRALARFTDAHICFAYLALGCVFALITARWRHRFLLQLLTHVAADLVVISLLYMANGGARSGLAILYLLPLAGAAVLSPLLLALFLVSLVTLFLLLESAYQILLGGDAPFMQSGLYGAAFFTVVLVVSRMAARLIGQEALATRRGADLAAQQAINQLVIAAVADGVLVLEADGAIHTINPAAQAMLGVSGAASRLRVHEIPALAPVAQAFEAWRAHGDAAPVFVTLAPGDLAVPAPLISWRGRRDVVAHLKLRFAAVAHAQSAACMTVVFLQDVTEIENQAQQLKLAAMGRLTASIAHEVRNPLAAIGHAGALLDEEVQDPAQRRLLRIVGDNVARVNRMIEDILRLSRKAHGEPLALAPFLDALLREFHETHDPGHIVLAAWPADDATVVRFDPQHLRQIVLNLLTNALRYASGARGSVRVDIVRNGSSGAELHVLDDGPGISREMRAHLFEPFYTTSSKGTGLGLYLARELGLNNEALLDYEYRLGEPAGRFVLRFAGQERAAAPAALYKEEP